MQKIDVEFLNEPYNKWLERNRIKPSFYSDDKFCTLHGIKKVYPDENKYCKPYFIVVDEKKYLLTLLKYENRSSS